MPPKKNCPSGCFNIENSSEVGAIHKSMRLIEVVLEDNFYSFRKHMVLEVLLVGNVGEAFGLPNLTDPVESSRGSSIDNVHESHDQLMLWIQRRLRIGLKMIDLVDGRHKTWVAEVLVVVGVLVDLHKMVK